LIRYHAAWVVPIAGRPLRDGWVTVDRGRVIAVGEGRTADGIAKVDLGRRALLPGLINAHTHLELSYLDHQIPAATEFTEWIRAVVAARRAEPDPSSERILRGVDAGIAQAIACGTSAVGDISNTLVTVAPLMRSPLHAVVFNELIRFRAPDPGGVVADACAQIARVPGNDAVRLGLAAHAPYSVAPGVFEAIRRAAATCAASTYSVHLSESRAESEFVASGQGPWRRFLEDLGAWDPGWVPPGGSPVAYLESLGFLGPSALAVHGVQMDERDLETLASLNATLVTCPRSNMLTGAGTPPIARFYASGVRVALGTDSLASTPDLNLFAELAEMRRLAPDVAAGRLLESATRAGAEALAVDRLLGTIEPGKSARLLSVALTSTAADVEEYLVGGVEPEQIMWVGEST
jgi:aminodeoxyfutalosine deaminase